MVARLLLSTLRHVSELLNREGILWDRNIDAMLVAFQDAGLRPKRYPPTITVGNQRFAQFLYQPGETDFDIQVDFLFAEQPFQQEALARRVTTAFPDWETNAFVLACEDLIVFKLVAGRIIDLADAAALLRANRNTLDFSALKSESTKVNVGAELKQVWKEAFPDETMPGEAV
ncbi:MAG: hypothetical protein H8E66_10905 [Planctomycetes bacterium]|nr:hypothetical protein [Planctomycetota bacterium]